MNAKTRIIIGSAILGILVVVMVVVWTSRNAPPADADELTKAAQKLAEEQKRLEAEGKGN